ncbi:MAG: hypothetical protein HY804_11870 [Nitrospinae bacterium]|nr:hypothetical protein [Nitrospinota bacterium]
MKNVVVTGLGMVTPLGIGVPATWQAALEGRSGVGLITRFDAADYPCRIAAEVKGFEPRDYIDGKEVKKMDTFIHYAIAAARFALTDAGIEPEKPPEEERRRVGAARALSRRNDEPRKASRPFDRDRDGFVMGEGSGVVLLERRDRALARGAKIYAELAGYGMSADAYHITAPPEGGEGAVRCMTNALADAGVAPETVGYINAHATSTMADAIETQAIKTVFGEQARKLVVSSTKSMTGHLLGAAGGVEAIFALKAMETGMIPPTINLDNPDPACDLDYAPHKPVARTLDCVLSNSFGFGGVNGTLVFKKFTP